MTIPRRHQMPEAIEPVRGRIKVDRLDSFVVTVRMDHFVTVKARSADHARSKGLEAAKGQWGAGLRPEVVEVESL